jgi:hypothetical protein
LKQRAIYNLGAVLPSSQKLTLTLLAIVALEVVLFSEYALFPAVLPFLKYILEIVFGEGVQHRLLFCLGHLSCDKMTSFSFIIIVETEKSKMGGHHGHVVFGNKNP